MCKKYYSRLEYLDSTEKFNGLRSSRVIKGTAGSAVLDLIADIN